jgi:xanthine dehydrogenase YagR molybdenum-binding subunit
MTAQIGLPHDRVDGPDKVKGSARYAAEFPRARLAHAVMVQSTRPSGTCRIDTRVAEASPGVVRVLTSANAPKLAGANKADPSKVRILSLLQDDQVHYNGQPIAVVVAETLEQARGAARRIDVQYSDSAAILDFDREKAKAYPPKKANMAETDVR